MHMHPSSVVIIASKIDDIPIPWDRCVINSQINDTGSWLVCICTCLWTMTGFQKHYIYPRINKRAQPQLRNRVTWLSLLGHGLSDARHLVTIHRIYWAQGARHVHLRAPLIVDHSHHTAQGWVWWWYHTPADPIILHVSGVTDWWCGGLYLFGVTPTAECHDSKGFIVEVGGNPLLDGVGSVDLDGVAVHQARAARIQRFLVNEVK